MTPATDKSHEVRVWSLLGRKSDDLQYIRGLIGDNLWSGSSEDYECLADQRAAIVGTGGPAFTTAQALEEMDEELRQIKRHLARAVVSAGGRPRSSKVEVAKAKAAHASARIAELGAHIYGEGVGIDG